MKKITKQLFFGSIVFFIIFAVNIRFAGAASMPVILYTDITSGPNTGGENNKGCYLSIFGQNFGMPVGNLPPATTRVYINNVEVGEYKYLGPSLGRPDVQQLSVQIGTGVTLNVSSGVIKVTVNGIESNLEHVFTVRPGDIYFMSHVGSDSAGVVGNITKPFRTANGVWDRTDFGADDFLVIRGDQDYNLGSGQENLSGGYRWINIDKSGSSDSNPITTYGYPGEVVTASFSANNQRGMITLDNPRRKYSVFANIIFDLNDTGAIPIYLGFYTQKTNALDNGRLVNLKVTEGMVGYLGVNPISIQHVDYLKMYGIGIGNQSHLAQTDLQSHMIYLSHEFNHADVGWCYIHDSRYGRSAFKVAGDGAQQIANVNVRIHDNLFENLPQEAIQFGEGARECFFYNNIINKACTKGAAVSGFSPLSIRGSDLNVGDYYIYNNTIYSDAVGADGHGGIIQMGYSPGSTYPHSITIFNNIVYAISQTTNYYQINDTRFTVDKITLDNNIWYGSASPLPVFANDELNADPYFVDSANGDFSLRPSSVAIDSGSQSVASFVKTDFFGTTRPQGAAFDIGAFEYVSTEQNVVIDTTPPMVPVSLSVE